MSVRDILLDADGNRVLVGADYGFAEGQQAVRQGIQCAVGMWLGEDWLDESLGVDYMGKILIKNPNELQVKAELSRAISAVADVTQVVSTGYSVNSQTREGVVSFTATSAAGTVSGTVTP
jgi:hypothetical protein